jgi:hypothetical protein
MISQMSHVQVVPQAAYQCTILGMHRGCQLLVQPGGWADKQVLIQLGAWHATEA